MISSRGKGRIENIICAKNKIFLLTKLLEQ